MCNFIPVFSVTFKYAKVMKVNTGCEHEVCFHYCTPDVNTEYSFQEHCIILSYM